MKPFEEYTRPEFVELVEAIYDPERRGKDALVRQFKTASGHPSGSDLIFWPDMVPGAYSEIPDPTPEDVIDEVVRWRQEQGLPLFASE